MSDPSADRDPFEVVAESFLARFRAGHRPSIEEYTARHPELADQIRELLPALVMVEQDLSVHVDATPAARDAIGGPSSQLGDYRILREIGRGGMGVDYEAEQLSLGRRVALKVLPYQVAHDPRALERFRREARSAGRLHHTNIVPVFEVGRDGDVAFYTMQFIQGQGLDQVIDELGRPGRREREAAGDDRDTLGRPAWPETAGGTAAGPRSRMLGQVAESLLSGRLGTEAPGTGTADDGKATEIFEPSVAADPGARDAGRRLPGPPPAWSSGSSVLPGGTAIASVDSSGRRRPYFQSVAQIGRQAAQGLAYAHARGVVHRDIKPSNLLLDQAGVVWITDFGLAKAEDDGLTQTGDVLGTLRYMAPCRFHGTGDARADVYSLGLTLYELMTLRPAFETPDRLKLIEQIKTEKPPRPRSVDARIPRELETIVLKAIEKDPRARYQSAEAMGDDLGRFLADEPIRARQVSAAERSWRWARRNPVVAGLGGVVVVLLVLATAGSLLAAQRFHAQAGAQLELANAREEERRAADLARGEEVAARRKADQANALLRAKEEELRRTVYATRSNLALAAWGINDLGRLRSPPRPHAAGPRGARPPGLGVALPLAARPRGSTHAAVPRRGVLLRRRGLQSRRADPRRSREERPHPALGPPDRPAAADDGGHDWAPAWGPGRWRQRPRV